MRKLFNMKCPHCGREYQYEGEESEWEYCPFEIEDAYNAPFRDFVTGEHLAPPFYDSHREYDEQKSV